MSHWSHTALSRQRQCRAGAWPARFRPLSPALSHSCRDHAQRAPTSPVQGEGHQRVHARLPTRYARALLKLPRWPLASLASAARADEPGSGRGSSARLRASSDALCARTIKLPRWPLASLASAARADELAARRMSRSSLPNASTLLHLWQRRPRTIPVTWQWSTQSGLPSSGFFLQIAQTPPWR